MKKQIIALSLGLMTIGAFAQKKELKIVEKALKNNDFKTAKATIESLEGTLDAMDAKYKAKYYFLRGNAYGKANVAKAAEAYNNLFAFEKETGKSKYTKAAQPKLQSLIQFSSDQAIKQYNSQDYNKAKNNFLLTYKLYPADTSSLFNAAKSATLDKDYDLALKHFNQLKEGGYTGVENQFLAKNKEGKDDLFPNKMTRDLSVKTGTHSDPVDRTTESKKGEILKNIALILKEQGKTDEAIVALETARKANPNDVGLILSIGFIYYDLKQMDKFAELTKEAIKLDPNNPELYYNLGVASVNQNLDEEAIEYYKKAIELKPDYGDAYLNIGVSIYNKRIPIIEKINENLSNAKLYNKLQLEVKAVYKEALPYMEKADSLNRSFDTVQNLLNIYDNLRMEAEGDKYRAIFKEMREKN